MYSLDGWINLFDVDLYKPGDDFRIEQKREENKKTYWINRYTSSNISDVNLEIRPINGMLFLVVNTLSAIKIAEKDMILTEIYSLVESYCLSNGLIYITKNTSEFESSYSVLVVRNGTTCFRNDPFFTPSCL